LKKDAKTFAPLSRTNNNHVARIALQAMRDQPKALLFEKRSKNFCHAVADSQPTTKNPRPHRNATLPHACTRHANLA
jgi:hypothetical protein